MLPGQVSKPRTFIIVFLGLFSFLGVYLSRTAAYLLALKIPNDILGTLCVVIKLEKSFLNNDLRRTLASTIFRFDDYYNLLWMFGVIFCEEVWFEFSINPQLMASIGLLHLVYA